MHYYRFNIKDWDSATAQLTLEERGVYFRLINHYYDKELPLPVDLSKIIKRLGLSNYEEQVQSVLEQFFTLDGDVWRHHVCDKLISAYQANGEKNRNNGAKGGRPKKSAHAAPNGEY